MKIISVSQIDNRKYYRVFLSDRCKTALLELQKQFYVIFILMRNKLIAKDKIINKNDCSSLILAKKIVEQPPKNDDATVVSPCTLSNLSKRNMFPYNSRFSSSTLAILSSNSLHRTTLENSVRIIYIFLI